MLQLDPNGTQHKKFQQNWSSTFSEQGRTKGQSHPGLPFQDLISALNKPNQITRSFLMSDSFKGLRQWNSIPAYLLEADSLFQAQYRIETWSVWYCNYT